MYNEALQYQQENCYEMTHTTTEKNGILNKLIMLKIGPCYWTTWNESSQQYWNINLTTEDCNCTKFTLTKWLRLRALHKKTEAKYIFHKMNMKCMKQLKLWYVNSSLKLTWLSNSVRAYKIIFMVVKHNRTKTNSYLTERWIDARYLTLRHLTQKILYAQISLRPMNGRTFSSSVKKNRSEAAP